MNTPISFNTVFPAHTMVHLFISNKPFDDCYALDDAYADFCQMGFNAVILEAERTVDEQTLRLGQENKKATRGCYILLVGDYSRQEDDLSSILTKMSKQLNEKGIKLESERIEDTLSQAGVQKDSLSIISLHDANYQPTLSENLRQKRVEFLSV